MKFSQLKLLTDENIAPKIKTFLRDQGFNVLDVKENGWQGRDDIFLLDVSMEENRFVVSRDADFGELVVRQRKPFYGIIYLRSKNPLPDDLIKNISKLIQLDPEVHERSLIIVGEQKIRIREKKI
jgi:predicted nuclease of predicted toxin-antitoxin system